MASNSDSVEFDINNQLGAVKDVYKRHMYRPIVNQTIFLYKKIPCVGVFSQVHVI